MQTTRHLICLLLPLVALTCGAGALDEPDNRQIDVTVTVLTPDGEPVEGIAINVATQVGLTAGVTNETGEALVSLKALPGVDGKALVRINDGSWNKTLDETQGFEVRHIFRQCLTKYAMPTWSAFPISAQENTYRYTLRLDDSVAVTGRFAPIDDDRPPLMIIGVNGQRSIMMTGYRGEFTLQAIRGQRTQLVYQHADAPWVGVHDLDADQLNEDIALADLQIPDPPENARVELLATQPLPEVTDPDVLNMLEKSLVMIREDGRLIYNLELEKTRTHYIARTYDKDATTVAICAGTYYLCPGGYGYTVSKALRAALLEGQAEALNHAGVPRIEADTHTLRSVVFDPKQAYDAIMSAASDLVP